MKKALTAAIVLAGVLAVSGTAFAKLTKPDLLKAKQQHYEQPADKGQLPPPPPRSGDKRPPMPPNNRHPRVSPDKRPPMPPRSRDMRPPEFSRTQTQQGVQPRY